MSYRLLQSVVQLSPTKPSQQVVFLGGVYPTNTRQSTGIAKCGGASRRGTSAPPAREVRVF
jgi:hypothetical protein